MIVDDSGENVEAIVSSLRNSGIAVRPSRPQHAEELGAMLAAQPIDLVLSARSQAIPLPQVLQRVGASGKDIPVILLADSIDENEWVEVVAGGASAPSTCCRWCATPGPTCTRAAACAGSRRRCARPNAAATR